MPDAGATYESNTDMRFDPSTKSWEDTGKTSSTSAAASALDAMEPELEVPEAASGGGKNSEGKAAKEQKKIEFNTLQGDMGLVPTSKNVRICAGSTVHATGFGSVISGDFYVKSRKTTLSGSGGLKMSITVIKTKFNTDVKGAPLDTDSTSSADANAVRGDTATEATPTDESVGVE